jgi:hypothetical protein
MQVSKAYIKLPIRLSAKPMKTPIVEGANNLWIFEPIIIAS